MCHGRMIDLAIRKARIAHRCSACSNQIYPGQFYKRQVVAEDGTVNTFKMCKRCLYAMEVKGSEITEGTYCLTHEDIPNWKDEMSRPCNGGWRSLLATLREGREAFRARMKRGEGVA